jgi:F-type H+-transporting ATPase subunit epsilon
MRLKISLPHGIFAEKTNVVQIVAETGAGSFGVLPNRRDFVAELVPGIFTLESAEDGLAYYAVDAGLMVKTGQEVMVSVRRAILGADLTELGAAVKREFIEMDEEEKNLRATLAKLESGFVQRLLGVHNARI